MINNETFITLFGFDPKFASHFNQNLVSESADFIFMANVIMHKNGNIILPKWLQSGNESLIPYFRDKYPRLVPSIDDSVSEEMKEPSFKNSKLNDILKKLRNSRKSPVIFSED